MCFPRTAKRTAIDVQVKGGFQMMAKQQPELQQEMLAPTGTKSRKVMGVGGEQAKEAWTSSPRVGGGWFSASCPPCSPAVHANVSANPAEMRNGFYPHCAHRRSLREGAWCCDCYTGFKALCLVQNVTAHQYFSLVLQFDTNQVR